MQMMDGGVWKLDIKSGAWTDITPDKPGKERKFGYAAVSVDAKNPKVVIAKLLYRPKARCLPQHRWRHHLEARVRKRRRYGLQPGTVCPGHGHPLAFRRGDRSYEFDHAMFTTGYGGWRRTT